MNKILGWVLLVTNAIMWIYFATVVTLDRFGKNYENFPQWNTTVNRLSDLIPMHLLCAGGLIGGCIMIYELIIKED